MLTKRFYMKIRDFPSNMLPLFEELLEHCEVFDSEFDFTVKVCDITNLPLAPLESERAAVRIARHSSEDSPYQTQIDTGRGLAYVRELVEHIAECPPILLFGTIWIDGVHRVAAARIAGLKELPAIDLQEYFDKYPCTYDGYIDHWNLDQHWPEFEHFPLEVEPGIFVVAKGPKRLRIDGWMTKNAFECAYKCIALSTEGWQAEHYDQEDIDE